MAEDGLPRAMPPLPPELLEVARAYAHAPGTHGATAKGVGWSTETAQMLRLRVLMRILDRAPPTISVHDLGCGWGALWTLLGPLTEPLVERYTGWDITPQMIELARRCHEPSPRVRFLLGPEPTEPADYGFVSGTFNFRRHTPLEPWKALVRDGLTRLADQCRLGMAFNLLSMGAPTRRPTMFYADSAEWVAFARTIARRGTVQLIDDYLPDDFTVLIRFG